MYFHLIDLPLLGSKISACPEQYHCREYQALDIPEVGGWKVASRKRLGSAENQGGHQGSNCPVGNPYLPCSAFLPAGGPESHTRTASRGIGRQPCTQPL